MRRILFALAVFALWGIAAAQAQISVIPGTGYAGIPGLGDSGTDAFGNSWAWGTTVGPEGPTSPGAGFAAWSTPGLGDGSAVYGSATAATNFEIVFLTLFAGSMIDKTPTTDASPNVAGGNEFTRFVSCSSLGVCVAWNPIFFDDNQVVFEAPSGVSLSDGEEYFVNVIFASGDINGMNGGFVASFSTGEPSTPELSTWAMLLLGFAGLGYAAFRRDVKIRTAMI